MKYITVVLVLLVVGCSGKRSKEARVKEQTIIEIKSEFNEQDVQWFKSDGNSRIKGIAKFKSLKGDIGFGEDFRIELNPYTPYTKERLNHIYKNNDSGYVYIENGIPKFTPDPEGYHKTRKTMCNAMGEFEFKNLPDGEYYIIAFMLWDETGGGLMQRVELKHGETKTIEMTNF